MCKAFDVVASFHSTFVAYSQGFVIDKDTSELTVSCCTLCRSNAVAHGGAVLDAHASPHVLPVPHTDDPQPDTDDPPQQSFPLYPMHVP